MSRQITIKNLVQFNALLLVTQSKFNQSKREIRLLGEYLFGRCRLLQQRYNCLSVKTRNIIVHLRNII